MLRRLLLTAGIAVIALLASYFSVMAVHHYLTRDRRGLMNTVDDLDLLARAMETYLYEHGRYPAAKSIDDLRQAIVPVYVPDFPATDGWGRRWHLVVDVTLPMRRHESVFPWFGTELLSGKYLARIRTPKGITERAFTLQRHGRSMVIFSSCPTRRDSPPPPAPSGLL